MARVASPFNTHPAFGSYEQRMLRQMRRHRREVSAAAEIAPIALEADPTADDPTARAPISADDPLVRLAGEIAASRSQAPPSPANEL